MDKITIYPHESIGKIKPMHATNNIPHYSNEHLLSLFAEAVPYARFPHTTPLLPSMSCIR